MCHSGSTSLPTYCFSELALTIQTKRVGLVRLRVSPLTHRNVTCSGHNIADKLPTCLQYLVDLMLALGWTYDKIVRSLQKYDDIPWIGLTDVASQRDHQRPFLEYQQYFTCIVAVCFIGGGNQSTRRKPPTCRKSLTNFIT
jgi:hypothetical protein